jgi:two-component system chemotaxis sensor kinase CheA
VVLDVDGCRFGLVVDEVHDTEEIVVKPLGRLIGKLPIYAGATILGDGQIALIVDPVVLAREARVDQHEAVAQEAITPDAADAKNAHEQLLVVQLTPEIQAAIPLHRVRRLEEFSVDQIERVGDSSVIQYRGSILQLVDVVTTVRLSTTPSGGGSVVVIGHGDTAVGLQVQSILDVASEVAAVRQAKGRPGIQSFGVIQGRVVALLDIDFLLRVGGPVALAEQVNSEVLV